MKRQDLIKFHQLPLADLAKEVAKLEVEAAKQSVTASEFNVRSAEASLKEAREYIFPSTPFSVKSIALEPGASVTGLGFSCPEI